jgi:hypothetical protein
MTMFELTRDEAKGVWRKVLKEQRDVECTWNTRRKTRKKDMNRRRNT